MTKFKPSCLKSRLPSADVAIGKGRKMTKTFATVAATALLCSTFAFASGTSFDAAANTVFSIISDLAKTIQSGVLMVVLPIGVAVAGYNALRMQVTQDAKEAAGYKKKIITTAIVIAVTFALPGLMQVAANIGTAINSKL